MDNVCNCGGKICGKLKPKLEDVEGLYNSEFFGQLFAKDCTTMIAVVQTCFDTDLDIAGVKAVLEILAHKKLIQIVK